MTNAVPWRISPGRGYPGRSRKLTKTPPGGENAVAVVFSILAIMWRGIFAALINNPYAFGISAGGHLLVIFGIFITAIVYDSAEKYRGASLAKNISKQEKLISFKNLCRFQS